MANLPNARPIISDPEWHNGEPGLATTMRKLAEAVEFGRRDYRWWPSDPKEIQNYATWANPANSVASEGADTALGTAAVPEPRGPHGSLSFRAWVALPNNTVSATLRFYSSTGLIWEHAFTGNSDLGGATSGWLAFTVPFPPRRDFLRVHLVGGAGTYGSAIRIDSWSAWWTAGIDGFGSQLSVPSGGWDFLAISQAFPSAGLQRSYATAMLKRMALSSNGYAAGRPPMVVAKHSGYWYNHGGAIASNPSLGRYRVWLSPRVTSLTGFVLARNDGGGGGLRAQVFLPNGTAISDLVVQGLTSSFAPYTLSFTNISPAAAREVEIRFSDAGGTSDVFLASVIVYENAPSAANLGLPGAETIPTTCPAQPFIAADAVIKASDVQAVVRGQVWLAGKKQRALICDSRFLGVATGGQGTNSQTLAPPVSYGAGVGDWVYSWRDLPYLEPATGMKWRAHITCERLNQTNGSFDSHGVYYYIGGSWHWSPGVADGNFLLPIDNNGAVGWDDANWPPNDPAGTWPIAPFASIIPSRDFDPAGLQYIFAFSHLGQGPAGTAFACWDAGIAFEEVLTVT